MQKVKTKPQDQVSDRSAGLKLTRRSFVKTRAATTRAWVELGMDRGRNMAAIAFPAGPDKLQILGVTHEGRCYEQILGC
jgi:hypothetical protein